MTRRSAHEPLGWRPTTLVVTIGRRKCTGCGHVWRQDITAAAEPRAKLSRRGLRWALEGIVVQHLTVARVAEGLGVAWDTANNAVLAEGKRVLIDDEHRFDGVKVLGVDEHAWRHTRRGDKYVTVIIDLTPVRDGTGPARLLDMVEGRSKAAFKTWLAERPQTWRDAVEVVAMDGFTGFKTAAVKELPDVVTVMDPFHVTRLAGEALDECRRRVQQAICGHRGRKGDVNSRISAAFAVLGSAVGLLTALVLGGDGFTAYHGLYGFNAVLCAIAIGGLFYVFTWRSAIYALLAAAFSVVAFAAIAALLSPLGMSALTAPFVLTTWLFLWPKASFRALTPVAVADITTAESIRATYRARPAGPSATAEPGGAT